MYAARSDRGLLIWAFLFACALLIARVVSTLLGAALVPEVRMSSLPASAEPDALAREPELVPLSAFLERDLFGAREARGGELSGAVACPPSSVRARLVATVIGEEGAIAWFEEGDSALRAIGVGDRIDGAEVISVERGAVRLSRDGECGEVSLAELTEPAERAVAQTPARTSVREWLGRREIEGMLANPMQFASDARIIPRPSERGFSLHAIRPGGIVAQLGFENGDVIQRINGQALDERDVHPFELLKGEELAIDYLRRGRPATRTVRIDSGH